MNMSIWQSIIMGIVSGFAELLPISSEAHRAVLRCLMGIEGEAAIFRLVVHLASLLALIQCSRHEIVQLRKTSAILRIPPRRRRHQPDLPTVYTIRILKTALVLLVFGRLFTIPLSSVSDELQILAFSMLANGVLLLIPSLVRNANKDSRNMTRLDGILMGLGGALSVIPGFSQVGATVSIGITRGVDRKYALKFAYLLLIPGLLIHLLFDLIAVFSGALPVFTAAGVIALLLGGVFAWIGSRIAYYIMNFLAFSTNFSAFSYYCFGFGLFTFVLFLTI